MSGLPSLVYQGRDWSSHRWTVAEAYDAIDRLQDLCLYPQWATANDPECKPETLHDLFTHLTQDLYGYLLHISADTIPHKTIKADCRHGLLCFEMMEEMRFLSQQTADMRTHQHMGVDGLLSTLQRIKTLIHGLDS